MMRGERRPKVSLGVPVYNGANYLREALDSLLAQTFGDFEIIICDNRSTDETPEICRAYAASDRRVRYQQNERNLGAAPNFNRTVALARGEYFKWAAHDDRCAPTFLEEAVRVLDHDRDCVLCYSPSEVIDETGQTLRIYDSEIAGTSVDAGVRFRALLFSPLCYEVFGLIRLDALRKTRLIGTYAHGDGVLLAQLALLGTIRKLSEPLFQPREHAKQSMAMGSDYHAYTVWFRSDTRNKIFLPHWRLLGEYLRSIHCPAMPVKRYPMAYRALGQWAWRRRRRFVRDLRVALEMMVYGKSDPAKRRLFR